MDKKEESRKIYIGRVNRVMDYVESHLDHPLTLTVLSDVAGFSPYHFHRIFNVVTGETLSSHIQRIRLEKAASLMQNDPVSTIGEIAYSCGFGSVSLFSRSFRSAFGMTATEFRRLGKAVLVRDDIRYTADGREYSKILKKRPATHPHLCEAELKNLIIMDTKIEIREMPAMQVVYVRHTGPFNQIGPAYGQVMKWAGRNGLLDFPRTKLVTVYHDDPNITAIGNVRQSACVTVDRDVRTDGDIGKMTIPASKCAVGRFEIDLRGFEKAWNTMCLWLTESGFQPGENSPYEIYHNDHTQHPEQKFIIDICIPVKPL